MEKPQSGQPYIDREIESNCTFLKGKCIEEFQAQYMTMKKKIGEY
jgi:hypothetical protein